MERLKTYIAKLHSRRKSSTVHKPGTTEVKVTTTLGSNSITQQITTSRINRTSSSSVPHSAPQSISIEVKESGGTQKLTKVIGVQTKVESKQNINLPLSDKLIKAKNNPQKKIEKLSESLPELVEVVHSPYQLSNPERIPIFLERQQKKKHEFKEHLLKEVADRTKERKERAYNYKSKPQDTPQNPITQETQTQQPRCLPTPPSNQQEPRHLYIQEPHHQIHQVHPDHLQEPHH